MRRLRELASIVDFLSELEIDEIQDAIDARRDARAGRAEDLAPPSFEPEPRVQLGGQV